MHIQPRAQVVMGERFFPRPSAQVAEHEVVGPTERPALHTIISILCNGSEGGAPGSATAVIRGSMPFRVECNTDSLAWRLPPIRPALPASGKGVRRPLLSGLPARKAMANNPLASVALLAAASRPSPTCGLRPALTQPRPFVHSACGTGKRLSLSTRNDEGPVCLYRGGRRHHAPRQPRPIQHLPLRRAITLTAIRPPSIKRYVAGSGTGSTAKNVTLSPAVPNSGVPPDTADAEPY
jgi:hypothetical protein